MKHQIMSSSTIPITKKIKSAKGTSKTMEMSVVQDHLVEDTSSSEEVSSPTEELEPMENQDVLSTIDKLIDKTTDRNKMIAQLFKDDISELKTLKRDYSKMLKSFNKMKRKRGEKKSGKPRTPSGIARESVVSTEVAEFLGLGKGERVSHTNLTKRIHDYIRENKLQDPVSRKWIVLDSTLKKLFGGRERVKYMGLNKYTAHHFKSVLDHDLSNFMGKTQGDLVTFDAIVAHIGDYVEKHNLVDKTDVNKFSSDGVLKKLFNKHDSHFDMHHIIKLVKHHLVSPVIEETVTTTSSMNA